MTLELRGRGKDKQLNGNRVSREAFEEVIKLYLSPAALQKLWRELELCSRVYLAFVFIQNDSRLNAKLDLANKKIADLERHINQLTLNNIYHSA